MFLRHFPVICYAIAGDGGGAGTAGGDGGQQGGGGTDGQQGGGQQGGGQQGGGQQGGGQQGGGAGGQQDGGQQGGSWRDALPDDLRGHATLAAFDSIGALAKEHVNAQDLIGRKGVIPPREDAGEEGMTSYWNQLRAAAPHLAPPETVEGYQLDKLEVPNGWQWHDSVRDGMLQVFHQAGASNSVAKSLLESYAKLETARTTALHESADQAAKGERQKLENEVGVEGVKAAESLINQLHPDVADINALRLENGQRLLDNPLLARVLVKVAPLVLEDGVLPGGSGGGFSGGASGAQAEINRIYGEAASDPKHPYNDPKHPEHQALHKRMMALQGQVHPGSAA